MAFTFLVEDGTGLIASNAYVAVTVADDYHAGRGHTDWTAASTGDKQAAIVRATDYIDKRFGRRFRGIKGSPGQALQWPRIAAIDNSDYLFQDVPTQLEKATSEYALISFRQGELAPAPNLPVPDEAVATGVAVNGTVITGEVKKTTDSVGPLSTSKEFRSASERSVADDNRARQSSILNDTNIAEYPVADMWMEELLLSDSSGVLARA